MTGNHKHPGTHLLCRRSTLPPRLGGCWARGGGAPLEAIRGGGGWCWRSHSWRLRETPPILLLLLVLSFLSSLHTSHMSQSDIAAKTKPAGAAKGPRRRPRDGSPRAGAPAKAKKAAGGPRAAPVVATGPDPALATLPATWADMHLCGPVREAIRMLRWATPTTVQRACVVHVRGGRDVAIQSRTGSGKTGAFVVPMVDRLVAARAVGVTPGTLFALVIVPSDELVAQTTRVVASITKYVRPSVSLFNSSSTASEDAVSPGSAGGTSSSCGYGTLLAQGADVAIVTAASLASALRRGAITPAALRTVSMLIVDEADLLLAQLSMRTITAALPPQRQTVLLSATLNDGVASLKGQLLHSPISISLTTGDDVTASGPMDGKESRTTHGADGGGDTVPTAELTPAATNDPLVEVNVTLRDDPKARVIDHRYIVASEDCHRHTVLYALLRLKLLEGRTIVFVDHEDDTFRLMHFLEQLGISAVVYDASMPVRTRLNNLLRFERGECLALICTDATLEAAEGVHQVSAMSQKDEDTTMPDGQAGGGETRMPQGHAVVAGGVHRGIDFLKVRNVILFDGIAAATPLAFARYTHRAGRTGRAGRKGQVITILSIPQAQRSIQQFREYVKGKGDHLKLFSALDRAEGAKLQYRVDTAVFNVTRNAAKKLRVATVASEMARSAVLRSQLGDGDTDVLKDMVSRARKKLRGDRHLVDVPKYMNLRKADSSKEYERRVSGKDYLRREVIFKAAGNALTRKPMDPLRAAVTKVNRAEFDVKRAAAKASRKARGGKPVSGAGRVNNNKDKTAKKAPVVVAKKMP